MFLASLMIGALLFNVLPAQAHVLIRDEGNSTGAVLHITPDDDPIAGQTSTIYFSIKGQSIRSGDVTATVTNTAGGQPEQLAFTSVSSGIESEYVFPSRGVYDIQLKINGPAEYTFNHTQRVSRGIGTDTSTPVSYPLATVALVLSIAGLLFTGLVYLNRKKDIDKQSKF